MRALVSLYGNVMAEFARHPVDLAPTRAFSPASIAKAYLRAMGIRPILARQPDFPREVLAYGMAAYYGGRAECRIRNVPVPVVYLDFRSQYPTVAALMDAWGLLTCERIEVTEHTAEVERLLRRLRPEHLFDPATWKGFLCLVQILPEGDVLPVRGRYHDGGTWQIGVNPLTSARPVWYALPDVIASLLLTGKAPRIVRALGLVAVGRAAGLASVQLRGQVLIDPKTGDFFRTLIEERARVERRAALPDAERERLSQVLKIVANSGAYGIFAELNRTRSEAGRREPLDLVGMDGGVEEVRDHDPEVPGEFFFSPIAACVAAAGRLMLAQLERLVSEAGGQYAFCDTDSMAIVATETGGSLAYNDEHGERRSIPILSHAKVDRIRARFEALDPYDRSAAVGAILKREAVNDEGSEHGPLHCLATSAKRYVLYRATDEDVRVVKASEHGLGHLLDPLDPEDERRDWIARAWERRIREVQGRSVPRFGWLDRAAVGRFTVTTPELLRAFEGLNAGRAYPSQVKPFNFVLTSHVALPEGIPAGAADPERFQLIAPWTRGPRQWTKARWVNRHDGRSYAITTSGTGGRGIARVKRYGEVLAEHFRHSEAKSLGPDGTACGPRTVGLLGRRPVVAASVAYVGKESNRLDEREAGLLSDEGEFQTNYGAVREEWRWDLVPLLRTMTTAQLTLVAGVDRSTAKRWRAGTALPRAYHRQRLARLRRER